MRDPKEDVMRGHLIAVALSAALAMPALAADQVEKAPPSGAYKKVSELVTLPDCLPGLHVWSRALVVHSSRWNGRMRYGPSSAWERPHDGGSASSDPA